MPVTVYASATQPQILKCADVQFAGRPMPPFRWQTHASTRHGAPRQPIRVLQTESQPILPTQGFSIDQIPTVLQLMGNRKPRRMGTVKLH